ncbi:hypothetical protein P879_09865 [Paragonimus westermani]|uniref:Uncharacterized protein n=1 Tax=Paragonimus westermani TaxID=34504 RepID=A0A8T0DC91_9TREM|nr:hypothetical protein P879_09865 [Paragonimus westermani]
MTGILTHLKSTIKAEYKHGENHPAVLTSVTHWQASNEETLLVYTAEVERTTKNNPPAPTHGGPRIPRDAGTQGWTQIQSEDPDLHPTYQRLLQGQRRPNKQEITGTSWETRCLWALLPKLAVQENVLHFRNGPPYLRRATAHHPEGSGLVERTSCTLKNLLKAFVNHETTFDSDVAWPRCPLAYRDTVRASTCQAPHLMVSGREPRLASDTLPPTDHHEPLLTSEHIRHMHSSLVRGYQLAMSHLQGVQRRPGGLL